MIQGFIFDMDGTMIDNMMTHHHCWQGILAEYGLVFSLEEVMEKCHGKNVEIIERLFPNRFTMDEKEAMSFEKERRYRAIFLPKLKLIKGLSTFLKAAHKRQIPLSIGTAASPENVRYVLDNLELHRYFSFIVHSDNVNLGKPHPEVYAKAAEGMKIPLSNCLVFEDSPTGARTAMNAGCPCIIITTTHREEEFKAFPNVVKFISDYSELTVNACLLTTFYTN
jgi:beta-phosphoglucomutase